MCPDKLHWIHKNNNKKGLWLLVVPQRPRTASVRNNICVWCFVMCNMFRWISQGSCAVQDCRCRRRRKMFGPEKWRPIFSLWWTHYGPINGPSLMLGPIGPTANQLTRNLRQSNYSVHRPTYPMYALNDVLQVQWIPYKIYGFKWVCMWGKIEGKKIPDFAVRWII